MHCYRLLFGKSNPSAKLTFIWYSDVNELDDIRDYTIRSSETSKGRTYQYFTGNVSYPFGYGLSYSNFEYSVQTDEKTAQTHRVC